MKEWGGGRMKEGESITRPLEIRPAFQERHPAICLCPHCTQSCLGRTPPKHQVGD